MMLPTGYLYVIKTKGPYEVWQIKRSEFATLDMEYLSDKIHSITVNEIRDKPTQELKNLGFFLSGYRRSSKMTDKPLLNKPYPQQGPKCQDLYLRKSNHIHTGNDRQSRFRVARLLSSVRGYHESLHLKNI